MNVRAAKYTNMKHGAQTKVRRGEKCEDTLADM